MGNDFIDKHKDSIASKWLIIIQFHQYCDPKIPVS